jgi:hypothetical protein
VYKVTGRAAAPLSGLFPESLSSYRKNPEAGYPPRLKPFMMWLLWDHYVFI